MPWLLAASQEVIFVTGDTLLSSFVVMLGFAG